MEFLSRSVVGDGPLVAFGGSDGVIRVLSMITWKVCNFIFSDTLDKLLAIYVLCLNVWFFCSLLEDTQEVIKNQYLV